MVKGLRWGNLTLKSFFFFHQQFLPLFPSSSYHPESFPKDAPNSVVYSGSETCLCLQTNSRHRASSCAGKVWGGRFSNEASAPGEALHFPASGGERRVPAPLELCAFPPPARTGEAIFCTGSGLNPHHPACCRGGDLENGPSGTIWPLPGGFPPTALLVCFVFP